MLAPATGRSLRARLLALVSALAIALTLVPAHVALAYDAPRVRVSMRASISMGLVAGRNSTYTLSAAVKTSDGSAPPTVVWASSRPGVVMVDQSGRLTALRRGSAVIRAKVGSARTYCTVTVGALPVRNLTLSRSRIVLKAGRSGYQLDYSLTPKNADNPAVTWGSSRPSVASVDRLTGYVTPLKPGTTLIMCRAADGTKKKAYCTVVVRPVMPTALSLSATELTVNRWATAPLVATVTPADATDKRLYWSSSNTAVATVSGGVVTGRSYGTAVITAKTRAGAVRARCTMRVGYYTTTFRALVIGQENYAAGRLVGPYTDAGLVNSMLVNSNFGGGKGVEVTLKNDLTAEGLRTELNNMASWGADADDVTYFYYSGHGDVDGSLVGTDYVNISVDEVRQYLDRIPGYVVVVLDSCYSGRFIRSKSASPAPSSVNPDAVNRRVVSAFSKGGSSPSVSSKTSLAESTTAQGKYRILTSCAAAEESYIMDGAAYGGASLFTYYLTRGAGVQAANWEQGKLYADGNGNRIVSLYEMYRYARPRILANKELQKYRIRQSVMMWPAKSTFTLVQRTP